MVRSSLGSSVSCCFSSRQVAELIATSMRARIEVAINSATWRELKQQLTEDPREDLTIQQFSEIYLDFCRKKNRRPDFHQEEIQRFLPEIGKVRLKDFTRADAIHLREWRSGQSVVPATVNRMISVLGAMFSYAFERGDITVHPMQRF